MTAEKLKKIIKSSPGLTLDGLLVLLDGEGVSEAQVGRCNGCLYSKNDLPVDKEHDGCISCSRYMKYKKPDGFCDEFVDAKNATPETDLSEADAVTVKKVRKRNAEK